MVFTGGITKAINVTLLPSPSYHGWIKNFITIVTDVFRLLPFVLFIPVFKNETNVLKVLSSVFVLSQLLRWLPTDVLPF